jgi:hypothetical protein
MEHYHALFPPAGTIPGYLQDLVLQERETLIGVYENVIGAQDESIVITDVGLRLSHHGEWLFIDYRQIERVVGPPDKQNVDGLTVHLVTGAIVQIPVRGGADKFRDAFEFVRFLMRVVQDVQRNGRSSSDV